MYRQRLATLQQIARANGLDAIALVPGNNLIVLTGQSFHLSERPVVGFFPAEGEPVVVLPDMERIKLAVDPPFPLRLISYNDTDGYQDAFASACCALGLAGKQVGVEGLRMRVLESQLLARHAPGVQIVDAEVPLAELRLRKGADEVANIRRAIAISQDALSEVIAGVKVAMGERQVANDLLIAMLKRGGGEVPFGPIVLNGPNSALPHGASGDRTVAAGELLLIDFGTTVKGYASDITRTFAVGELHEQRLVDAYAAVRGANEAGRQAAGPDVPCQEVDRAARAVIEAAGFGEYFVHRTGHGLGMDIHEPPYLREGNAASLAAGHVITIEPGVYIPGLGGIRIEDDVLVTADGAESLTTFPRDLQVIGA